MPSVRSNPLVVGGWYYQPRIQRTKWYISK
jgi:hypothetical protein